MTVLDDFSAGADDELNVESGQTVYMLYTEQEWMYVLVEDGREGFIPRWVGVHRVCLGHRVPCLVHLVPRLMHCVSCLVHRASCFSTACAMFSTSCALCVMLSASCVMF